MNDSPINLKLQIARTGDDELASDAPIPSREPDAVQTEKSAVAVIDSPGKIVTLRSDELNDLFLEAENTARRKAFAEIERSLIENQGLKLQNERLKDENARLVELHNTRKQYVGRLFWLISAWLGVVVLFVALSAVGLFTLSNSVLIAFITSTTVSVIALFLIVAKWLFPSAGEEKGEK